jgi:nitrous oxidase accessory protein
VRSVLTICALLATLLANSSTIEVGAAKPFKTIKSAIASAKNGDEIIVSKGVYTEGEIIIDKQLMLRGINWPVIDAQNKSQAIRIQSDKVIIEGFEVRNAAYSSSYDWAAIKIINSKNVVVRNNRLYNNASGIYFQNASLSEISNNTIQGNTTDEILSGNAIHCWKSDNIKILNNSLTGHRDGIYFEFVTSSLIQNNNSFKNLRYGLHFMFSNNDSYIHNTFKMNGAGVAVMFSKNVTMRWNLFQESWGGGAYGILMKEIADGTVERNTFLKNTVGIYMEGTSRIFVSNNIFKSNGWAMRVQSSCDNNTITLNNYFGNTFDVGTNGTLQLNKFRENYWDKYEGYDLNKDGYGDVQYMPVSLYSMIVEKNPSTSLLLRSFMVTIMDKAERVIPSITPIELKDEKPLMKPLPL